MQGVHIKIFYGYRYYDDEYDLEKTGYDYAIIGKDIGDDYATRRVKKYRTQAHRGYTGYAHTLSNYLRNRVKNITELLRRPYSEE